MNRGRLIQFAKDHIIIVGAGIFILALVLVNYGPEIIASTFQSDDTSHSFVSIDNNTPDQRGDIDTRPGVYELSTPHTFPSLSARSYLIADLSTGQVLFEKDSQSPYPIASITKLMTAIVSEERLPTERIVTVSPRAQQTGGGLRGGLSTNQRIALDELRFPLLMTSSNNGAEVIAETFGRQFFIEQMNKKAGELGMWDTYFDDPSGLSSGNISSADDLFLLMQYLFNKHTDILKISRLSFYSGNDQTWRNISTLLREPTFRGGKTGFTNAARQTSAGIYRARLNNDAERLLVIVILGSENRAGDIRSLMQFIERYVQYKEISEEVSVNKSS